MQPYFDPTRKTTSKKNERQPQKRYKKMEDDLKRKERKKGRRPTKNKDGIRPKKNGRRTNQPKST